MFHRACEQLRQSPYAIEKALGQDSRPNNFGYKNKISLNKQFMNTAWQKLICYRGNPLSFLYL